jgi:hypothetical protein
MLATGAISRTKLKFVDRRVDRVRRADQEERIAVCWRAHDRFGGEIGVGARSVFEVGVIAVELGPTGLHREEPEFQRKGGSLRAMA